MSALTTVTRLAGGLRTGISAEDGYADMIINQASNAVRDYTGQQGWVLANPSTGETVAPQTAQDVTLWVAMRAYTNPLNMERRTAGPISHTFRDSGVYGVELTENEKERLKPLAATTRSNGLWVQPTGARSRPERVYLADPAPGATSILFAEGNDLVAFTPNPLEPLP